MTGGYARRPIDMVQRFGYYWPDGAPANCGLDEVHASSYRDQDGQEFHIAYTHQQILDGRFCGIWAPFIPLFVSGPPYQQELLR